jgi:SAM-dependent methyltransferase
MSNTVALAIVVVGLLLLLGVAGWWLLITTEGVFLGRRVVVWLYDLTAGRYDAIKQFDPDSESAFVIWPLRRRLKGPSPLVLDVATGTGRLPYFLLQEPSFHGRVVGLDASGKMLAAAQAKLRPFGGRAVLLRGSAGELPFAGGALDAVTCLEALEFLPDDAAALREMVRVLRPGGALLVTRRCGPEARYFLGRDRSRETFEVLLAGMGLIDILIQPWQVEYDLVWAAKPQSEADAGVPEPRLSKDHANGRVMLS